MSIEGYRAAKVIEIPKDSTATVLEWTVVNDGAVVDLTGATGIKLNTKTIDGTAVDTDVAGTITNSPGTDGKVDLPLSAGTVGTIRDLVADVRYTPSGGGEIVSYPAILRIMAGGKP